MMVATGAAGKAGAVVYEDHACRLRTDIKLSISSVIVGIIITFSWV